MYVFLQKHTSTGCEAMCICLYYIAYQEGSADAGQSPRVTKTFFYCVSPGYCRDCRDCNFTWEKNKDVRSGSITVTSGLIPLVATKLVMNISFLLCSVIPSTLR